MCEFSICNTFILCCAENTTVVSNSLLLLLIDSSDPDITIYLGAAKAVK